MRFILFVLIFFTSFSLFAGYQTYTKEEIITESDERKARRKAIDQAIEAVTIDQVKKMIGDVRYTENKDRIES